MLLPIVFTNITIESGKMLQKNGKNLESKKIDCILRDVTGIMGVSSLFEESAILFTLSYSSQLCFIYRRPEQEICVAAENSF
jgi:hypothetical protein